MSGDPSEASPRSAYDRVPYPSLPWRYAHPARLATLARLHGRAGPDPASCRMLEIGCADGGNLMPLADAYPESEFVGVDLSGVHIRAAAEVAGQSGLENVTFHEMSLADIGEAFGSFDYIMAHGVLSWVSDDLGRRLLEVCRDRLAPSGVVFLSYNTYPGWHMRQMVREILLDRTRGIEDLGERVDEAQRFLELLAGEEWGGGRDEGYVATIRSVLGQFVEHAGNRHYLAHEYLAEDNHPFVFRDFVRLSAGHGLAYLADANPGASDLEAMDGEGVRAALSGITDRIGVEQTLDQARGRFFRQSLLIHAQEGEEPELDLGWVGEMHIAAALEPVAEDPGPADPESREYRDGRGVAVHVSHPLTKAALALLRDVHPVALPWAPLVGGALELLGAAGGADAEGGDPRILAAALGSLWRGELVEYQAHPYPFSGTVPARPRAGRLARHLARSGREVTSLRHETVVLDDVLARRVLALLDGTRDREDLARESGLEEDRGRLEGVLNRLARLALIRAL